MRGTRMLTRGRGTLCAATAVLALAVAGTPAATAADKLHVYEKDGPVNLTALKLLTKAFDLKSTTLNKKLGALNFVDTNVGSLPLLSGGAGAVGEDGKETVIKGFDLGKLGKIKAPGRAVTVDKLDKLFKKLGLRPAGAKLGTATSDLYLFDQSGKTIADLHPERQMAYALKLAGLPLDGPGAKIAASWDWTGEISQMTYTLPELDKGKALDKIPVSVADAAAKLYAAPCTSSQPQSLTFERKLTYYAYSALEFPKADKVLPQYMYTPTLNVGGEKVTLRTFSVPAVKTNLKVTMTAKAEGPKVIGDATASGGDGPYKYAWMSCSNGATGAGDHVEYVPVPRLNDGKPFQEELIVTVYDANGVKTIAKQTVEVTPAPVAGASRKPRAKLSVAGTNDAGAEFIGTQQGLGGSAQNTQGFVDRMRNSGYQVPFVYGNADVWESDFTDSAVKAGGNDTAWADNVDIMWYTGHANSNGFTTSNTGGGTGDGFVAYNEARWGNNDLEWLVIAACGPLQYDNGQVWTRWARTFHGLHMLLGYATVSNDNTTEGSILANYLHGVWPFPLLRVRDAWFNTAVAVQPSSVIVGYFGVLGPNGMTNIDDYIWSRGAVGPDIANSQITGGYAYYRYS